MSETKDNAENTILEIIKPLTDVNKFLLNQLVIEAAKLDNICKRYDGILSVKDEIIKQKNEIIDQYERHYQEANREKQGYSMIKDEDIKGHIFQVNENTNAIRFLIGQVESLMPDESYKTILLKTSNLLFLVQEIEKKWLKVR